MPTKISHDLTLKDSFYKESSKEMSWNFILCSTFPQSTGMTFAYISFDGLEAVKKDGGICTPKTFQKQSSIVALGEDEAILFLWGSKQRPSLPNLVSKTGPTWLGGFYFFFTLFLGRFPPLWQFLCLDRLKPPSCTIIIVDASEKCWEPQLKGEFLSKNSEESRRRHPTCRFEWLDCFQAELMWHAAEGYWCGPLNGLIHPK